MKTYKPHPKQEMFHKSPPNKLLYGGARGPGMSHPVKENSATFDIYENPPQTRGDCLNNKRPCPWIRCKHHLIWINDKLFKKKTDDEIADFICDMKHSCTLDLADLGGSTLDAVAQVFDVTRERIRQIQEGAFERMQHFSRKKYLIDFIEP